MRHNARSTSYSLVWYIGNNRASRIRGVLGRRELKIKAVLSMPPSDKCSNVQKWNFGTLGVPKVDEIPNKVGWFDDRHSGVLQVIAGVRCRFFGGWFNLPFYSPIFRHFPIPVYIKNN